MHIFEGGSRYAGIETEVLRSLRTGLRRLLLCLILLAASVATNAETFEAIVLTGQQAADAPMGGMHQNFRRSVSPVIGDDSHLYGSGSLGFSNQPADGVSVEFA